MESSCNPPVHGGGANGWFGKFHSGLASKPKEHLKGNFQGVGKFLDAPQGGVARAALNVGDVGALQMCTASQFVLGDATPGSPAFYGDAKCFFDVLVFHKSFVLP